MKKLIYSSLFAMLLLVSCQHQEKKEATSSIDTSATTMAPITSEEEQKIYDVTSIDSPATYPGGSQNSTSL